MQSLYELFYLVTCSCELFSGLNTESFGIPGMETSLSVARGDVCIGTAGPCRCDDITCMVRVLIHQLTLNHINS